MSAPAAETAEERLARLNPPGQRQLRFRAGTYGTFLRRMLAQLPRAEVHVDGGPATRPLETLDPGSSGDFAAALLDAWATVGDVLGFYQERILNEGFLRTALEARSIRELTSQLGFPLQPGLAAGTWLAFGVSAAPGARTAVVVPAGTAAQSIPGTDETAQTFETSAPLRALPAWNALRAAPAFTTVAPSLAVGGAEARLAGTGTGLTVGAPVLAAAADGAAWTFGTVTAVETAPRTGETRVAWTVAEKGTGGTGPMANPEAWAFGRTARLFGYDAAAWDSLTTEQKRAHREILGGVFVLGEPEDAWTGASGGLPAADVRVLAVDEGGRLYAGTAGQGLYASADGGRTWAVGGPRYADVHALAAAGDGIVYAGLAAGRVYRSSDGGATWDSLSGATAAAPAAKGEGIPIASTRLPAAPVRALYAAEDGTLYAGTDFGVYRAAAAMPAWSAVPFHASAHSPAETAEEDPDAAPASSAKGHGVAPAVWCFARAPWGELVAGTDAGVWSVDHRRALGEGIPRRAPDGLPNVVRALVADGTSLLAATDAGLFALGPPARGADAPGPGAAWKPADAPRAGGGPLAVRALAPTPRGLLAATSSGVFRRAPAGTWAPVGTVPPPPAAADEAGGSGAPAAPAGADGKGGAETGDCGRATPIPAPPGLNHPDVTALAAGAGRIVAAAPYAGFPVEAWPSPPICPDTPEPGAPDAPRPAILYLAGVIPQVVPGSWMVLHQAPDPAGSGGPPPAVALVRVQATRILTLERYGSRGQATEVRVAHAGGLDGGLDVFGVRDTRVYAAARRLPLVSARLPRLVPVSGTRLKLAGAAPAPPAGRVVSVTGKRLRAAVWPRAGVFVSCPDGWAPAGLASVDVDAVAWGPGGTLLAAVGGAPGAAGPAPGVYASADGGAAWLPAGGALDGVRVHALAAGPGAVWAARRTGAVFTLRDGGRWAAAGTAGQPLAALAAAPDGRVYAATDDGGVLRRGADGGWTPAGRALPAGRVRALAASAAGVATATAHGVWWLAAGAPAWTPWNEKLANLDVHSVALLPDGGALAGTWGGGVFASPAPGEAWAPASAGLDAPGARTVRVLAATEDGRAWAGTQGAGCWMRPAGQTAWVPAVLGAANDVGALAAGPGGVIAGCGAVPLLAGGDPPRALLGLDGVLALDEGAAAGLDQGSLSTAVRAAFTAAGVPLDPAAVVRVQEPGRAWWIDAGDGVLLLRHDAGAVRVRRPRGLATLMGPPHATSAGGAMADPEGSEGTLTPRAGELLWRPASAASQPVGEVALVAAGAAAGVRGPVLTLRSPLANAYDPATVQVCANLAPATHGHTQGAWPRPEALGSGSASVAGQVFALPRAPLTWLAGAPGSTLRVWVNGVEWTEVETLFGRGPAEAAFEVRVDERGAAAVRFGDGVHGARLPTGVGNVTGQYRTGNGPAGNLAAGRISVLRAAPLGVRSAVNPVAADGGAPGETNAGAAAAAPLRARVLERVVALRDFHDYALGFPGIARAAAEPLRDRRGRAVVVITVAGGPGAEVPDAGLLAELEQAMRDAGAHGRFRVLPCDALRFVLRARVDCDPRRRPGAVARAASAALRAEFAPARRGLGQGVAASDVVAVLQAVPGVVGVELAALHLAGDTPAACNYLDARGARVDPRGGLLAAQLLLPAASEALGVVAREAP